MGPAQRLAASRVPTRWDVAGRAPAADAAPTRPLSVGDQPVATAGACATSGVAEIDWVATLPTHHRQGIGAAMTAAAASTDPTRAAVLLASDDGHDLYRRLGFVDLLRLTIWEHPHQPTRKVTVR